MKKRVALVLTLFLITAPFSAGAVDLGSVIANLKAQIESLQAEVQRLLSGGPVSIQADFNTFLSVGSEHPQVRLLQQFLAADTSLYPEGLITGYFGPLTEGAVRRFQARYQIPAIGVVGPQTRAKLNDLISASLPKEDPEPETEEKEETPGVTVSSGALNVVEELETSLNDDYTLDAKPRYNLPRIEKLIQDEINKERAKEDAQELEWNDALASLARLHVGDHVPENLNVTNPEKVCTYPILHHSGFTFGESVGERAKNLNISFRRIGENLALFRASENLVYRYRVSDGPVNCPKIESVDPFVSSKAEINDAIEEREDILSSIRTVNWINREWLSETEIAKEAVDLWLDSPSHRKNMLNPEFSEGGVGLSMVNDHIIAAHILRNP